MNKYAKLLLGVVSGIAFITAAQEAKANPITDTIERIACEYPIFKVYPFKPQDCALGSAAPLEGGVQDDTSGGGYTS